MTGNTNDNDNEESSTSVLLSFGANLGDRINTINKAFDLLINTGVLTDAKLSSFYETEPVGFKDQPWFINAAALACTSADMNSLLQICKSIEYLCGRTKRALWTEREIDIDLLIFGDTIIDRDMITIPHPRMHERRFVLEPASEVAPAMIHPLIGKTVAELLAICPDKSEIKRIDRSLVL